MDAWVYPLRGRVDVVFHTYANIAHDVIITPHNDYDNLSFGVQVVLAGPHFYCWHRFKAWE
jgi:hypothetical protein